MKFRKYIIELIVVIFCLGSLILSWYDKEQYNKEFEYRMELFEKKSKIQTGITDFVLKKELIQYNLEGRMLNDSITLTNINYQKIKIDKIYKLDEPVLFFVFTGESCNKCVNLAIEEIKIFNSAINGKVKICMLSNFDNYKSQLFFANKFIDQNIEVFSFRKESNLFPDNIIPYPFFFSVSNEMKISDVYVHDQMFSHITHKYLEIMLNKFEIRLNGSTLCDFQLDLKN